MAPSTLNPNSVLKDAREAKGITLEIVHEATKIPMDALKALEQGYSVKILTPFYLRGFIKIYAEFLGLETNEVLKAYHLDKAAVKPVVEAPLVKKPVKESKQSVGTPKQKPTRISQPQTGEGGGFEGFDKIISARNIKGFLVVVGVGIAIFAVLKLTRFVIVKMQAAPKNHQVTAAVKPGKELLKGPKEVKSAGLKTFKAQSSNQKAELALRANKDSFIQVKVDGKVVFAMVMQKGTVETWSANEEIILSGKDLYDLDMEINGNHIGSLGTIERRAHRVVITKEGLTVKK